MAAGRVNPAGNQPSLRPQLQFAAPSVIRAHPQAGASLAPALLHRACPSVGAAWPAGWWLHFFHVLSPWIKLLHALPSHNSSREPSASPRLRASQRLVAQPPASDLIAAPRQEARIRSEWTAMIIKITRGENSKALLRLCTAINLPSCMTRGAVWKKAT